MECYGFELEHTPEARVLKPWSLGRNYWDIAGRLYRSLGACLWRGLWDPAPLLCPSPLPFLCGQEVSNLLLEYFQPEVQPYPRPRVTGHSSNFKIMSQGNLI